MKLFYNKNSKDPIYYARQGIRNGAKTTTRNVGKLGRHSGPLEITDDPLAYVKEELRKMSEECRVGKVDFVISVDFNERVKHSSNTASSPDWLNIGYFFLQAFLGKLRLQDFFHGKTNGRRITFDCCTIHRFLTYAGILDPLPKYTTWHKLDSYYGKPDFDYQHILHFMDLLEENHDDYLTQFYRQSNTITKRDTSVLYYDCMSSCFECEQEDEDIMDEVTGEVMEGLRQYGRCKEHRPGPVVEMGLFMDSQGVPITMCLHPGSTSRQLTTVPLEKEVLSILPDIKFICCADAGLGSHSIKKFNNMDGRAFIVTQSVKKLSDTLKKAVFNDYGYRLLSDNSLITIRDMKAFDRHEKDSLGLHNNRTYKVIVADKVMDLGLYEDVALKNGRTAQ